MSQKITIKVNELSFVNPRGGGPGAKAPSDPPSNIVPDVIFFKLGKCLTKWHKWLFLRSHSKSHDQKKYQTAGKWDYCVC